MKLVSQKSPKKPAWWKNTYFWISALLLIVAICGLPFLGGQDAIRDPGQKRESGLAAFYLLAAVIMLVNGMLSHRQTMHHYEESLNEVAE